MVLDWTIKDNSVNKELLDRIAKFESRVTLIETQNSAQKEEISKLKHNNLSIELEKCELLQFKRFKMNLLNAFGSEQKER